VTQELRTPLTSMRTSAEILLDNPDLPRDQRERFLRVIVEEIERLTRLINRVLDPSNIHLGRVDGR
jgi:signal transduction histidine kinase